MTILTGRAARILYSVPMILFGSFHFMNAEAMAPMVPVPGGIIWIYITGLALIAAPVAIIIEKMDQLAAFLLGVLLFSFAFGVHLKGMMTATEEMAKMMSMISFMKDFCLASAAWIISGVAAKRG